MNIRYLSDADTGLPHMYAHGVREDEVADVLRRPGETRPGDRGSWVASGRTRAGRYLKVVYKRDEEPGSVFVITAYDLKGKPLVAYRRRRRGRNS